MSPIFRLLAIVETAERALRLVASARELADIRLGLMLRDPEHRPERVRALAEALDLSAVPSNVTLLTNGIVLPGIDAVHLPGAFLNNALRNDEKMPSAPPRPIGYSTHDLDQIRRAESAGADYVTFGPIFPTSSKPGHPGCGVDALAAACRATRLPIFALGGITTGNYRSCLDAGAHGIASISLFADAITRDLLDDRFTSGESS